MVIDKVILLVEDNPDYSTDCTKRLYQELNSYE